MRSLVTFLLFISSFFPEYNFHIITRYDEDTLLAYHRLARHYRKVQTETLFSQRNLVEYCDELRKSRIYMLPSAGDPFELGHPNQHSLPHNVTALSLEIERNQMGMQTVTFHLENSNRTLPHQTFQCVDFDEQPKWFVAPAFFPHSAFLFRVEPDFAHVFTRTVDQSINKDIRARFVAIVDESATRKMGNVSHILSASVQTIKRSGRDPLCKLNPILQYRLCAIIASFLAETMYMLRIPFRSQPTYHDRWYRLSRGHCRPLNIDDFLLPARPEHNVILDMLYCYAMPYNNTTTSLSFYIHSNMIDRTKVIPLIEFRNFNSPGPHITYSVMSYANVPLLKHYKEYDRIIGDANIYSDHEN